MDADWLPFDPDPSKPTFLVPSGSVDAHCHVFGPAARFPFSPQRKYTPCDAPKEKLFALRDYLGFKRNVIVQATCHGTDNRALVDALQAAGDLAKGVAAVDLDVSDETLADLNTVGIKGVRFNFLRRLVDPPPQRDLYRLARRIKELGWHVVLYFEASDLEELFGFFSTLPVPFVVDHMGRPDVTKPVEGAQFQRFCQLLDGRDDCYTKLSCPERLSREGPPGYTDVVPFARHLMKRFPERVLWGTDWPHPNMKSHMPDDGLLVDYIPSIAPSEEEQIRLLVDNPMRLYWPELSW